MCVCSRGWGKLGRGRRGREYAARGPSRAPSLRTHTHPHTRAPTHSLAPRAHPSAPPQLVILDKEGAEAATTEILEQHCIPHDRRCACACMRTVRVCVWQGGVGGGRCVWGRRF